MRVIETVLNDPNITTAAEILSRNPPDWLRAFLTDDDMWTVDGRSTAHGLRTVSYMKLDGRAAAAAQALNLLPAEHIVEAPNAQ